MLGCEECWPAGECGLLSMLAIALSCRSARHMLGCHSNVACRACRRTTKELRSLFSPGSSGGGGSGAAAQR